MEQALEKTYYRSYADDIEMHEATFLECPDFILTLTDEYMASLVLKLSEQYKNIMVVTGYGQTRTIPHYLYYSQAANTRLLNTYKPVYENLVRKDNPEL